MCESLNLDSVRDLPGTTCAERCAGAFWPGCAIHTFGALALLCVALLSCLPAVAANHRDWNQRQYAAYKGMPSERLLKRGEDFLMTYMKPDSALMCYTVVAERYRPDMTNEEEQMLDEALKVAANADVIIAALGESSEMSGESSSRTNLALPDVQRTLLEALLKTGKPVVLTLFTGRPLTLTWEQEHVPAILNVWFGGSEAAYAIGDVLFGDVNPSGKLTMTFPKNVGQIPLFYNHKNTGRPLLEGKWFEKFRSNYLDVDNDPLHPFGYGLSYTNFQYSDITLSAPTMGQDGSVTAMVTVTNTGKYDGAEVVQLYIRDLVGSITRPVKELKGFDKIFLKAGESKTVSFKITPELLRFYDYELNYVAEPGDFDIMIGGNSQSVKTTHLSLK